MITIVIVNRAYRLNGIVEINAIRSLSNTLAVARVEPTAAAQDDTGAMIQIGAAVESIR
jgi:hypothetical protein